MEISTQIKKYRNAMELSQEDLAEKIYVTRQTISNWENEKSYPDIHSLLLLSSLFNVSLDQLIKAGCMAAKTLTERGHEVILLEKSGRLGGKLHEMYHVLWG